MSTLTVKFAVENNRANLSGPLVFDNVLAVLPLGLNYIQTAAQAIFDFSAVKEADSASIALLLEWWRAAEKLHKKIRFHHLPASMRALITVSSLESVNGFFDDEMQ
jgi:ABC-type transporter Mla MlaB component